MNEYNYYQLIIIYCNKIKTQINYHLILLLTLFFKNVKKKLLLLFYCFTDYVFKTQ
jgi:hypothetical protein